MFTSTQRDISGELDEIRSAGLFKAERVIVSPQGSNIRVGDGQEVLNLCANNYLGLADDPRIVAAAKDALDRWGDGLASVRFICGTQDVHKQLEQRISGFLGTEDTILYSSCFDANGGLFETLLSEQDAVINELRRVPLHGAKRGTHGLTSSAARGASALGGGRNVSAIAKPSVTAKARTGQSRRCIDRCDRVIATISTNG